MSVQKDLQKFGEAEQALIMTLYKKYVNMAGEVDEFETLSYAQIANFLLGESVDINKAQISEHKKMIFNKKYLPKIKDFADYLMKNDSELNQLILVTLRLKAHLLTKKYGPLWRDSANGIRTYYVLDRYGTTSLINVGIKRYRMIIGNFIANVDRGRSPRVEWFHEL